jgi:hypothetical protein
MIKKQIALAATAVVLILGGCGEDRSHPKGVDANGNPIEYKNPTAIIDLNNTTHTYVPALDQYTVGGGARTTLNDPFIFSGARSHDNDENNQSITQYAWSISHTFSNACVDINQTGDSAIFKFLHTVSSEADYNETCRDEAINNGEINATLTVTDNEEKRATTTKVVKTN